MSKTVKIDEDIWEDLDEYSRENGVRKKHIATEGIRKELKKRVDAREQ